VPIVRTRRSVTDITPTSARGRTALPPRLPRIATERLGAGRAIVVRRALDLVLGTTRAARGCLVHATLVARLTVVERIAQRRLAVADIAGGDAARAGGARRAALLGLHAQRALALHASDRATATASAVHARLVLGTTMLVVASKRGVAVVGLAGRERDHEKQRGAHVVTLPCVR
jgi:hypothetical protein